jgi:tetratricopeptide (TPR) repeat protein
MNIFNEYLQEAIDRQEYEWGIRYACFANLLEPYSPAIMYDTGLCWQQLGNFRKAERFFKKSIKFCPNYPLALKGLMVLSGQKNKRKKVLKYALLLEKYGLEKDGNETLVAEAKKVILSLKDKS